MLPFAVVDEECVLDPSKQFVTGIACEGKARARILQRVVRLDRIFQASSLMDDWNRAVTQADQLRQAAWLEGRGDEEGVSRRVDLA